MNLRAVPVMNQDSINHDSSVPPNRYPVAYTALLILANVVGIFGGEVSNPLQAKWTSFDKRI
jgi:hypothetical protein